MLYCIIKVRNRGVTVYQVALSPSPYHSGPDYYHCNHFPQNTFKSLHFVGGSYTLTIIVSHLPPTTCYSTMSRCVMFVCNRAQLISTNQSMFFQDKAWLKLPVFNKSTYKCAMRSSSDFQLTFVSVHLTTVGNERHLLRPAHVFVPDCGGGERDFCDETSWIWTGHSPLSCAVIQSDLLSMKVSVSYGTFLSLNVVWQGTSCDKGGVSYLQ